MSWPPSGIRQVQVPANAVIVRHHDPMIAGMTTTRFCTTAQATCEPANAFGIDIMYGDTGDDTMWGQDGNDVLRGGAGNDDMYGELGNDTMYGDGGQARMLADRGGIVDTYINGSGDPAFAAISVSVQAPPPSRTTPSALGTYDRRVDLYHDIDGEAFVAAVPPTRCCTTAQTKAVTTTCEEEWTRQHARRFR
jgi:hypothetical protein